MFKGVAGMVERNTFSALYPAYWIKRVSGNFPCDSMLKSPFTSVVVPNVVPLMTTFADGKTLVSLVVTRPFMACAKLFEILNNKIVVNKCFIVVFIISLIICD